MKEQRSQTNIPPEGIETPLGYLYNPPGLVKQIFNLVVSFFAAIFLGWIVSSTPGDLSDFTKAIFYIPYILVFFFGYSVWIGWLNVIVLGSIKLPLIKILFRVFVRKEKPDSLEKLLPSRDQAIEIMVRA